MNSGCRPPALGLLLLLAAVSLGVPDRASAQAGSGAAPAVLVSVLGGVQGTDPSPHLFGGLNASATFLGATGFEVLALVGSGRSYSSALVATGPAFRIVDGPGLGVRAWGGLALYGESLTDPGIDANDRTVVGFGGGVMFRVPVWRGALTGGIVHWRGSYDDAGFARSASMSGTRLVVGVGR
jgi:hypothetical protein